MLISDMEATEFLRSFDFDSVDLVLTDPPYSSGGLFRADRNQKTSTKYQSSDTQDVKPEFFGDSRDQRSLERWMAEICRESWQIVKPHGMMMFMDWRNLACAIDALQMGGFTYKALVPWVKPNARPQKGMFRAQCEYVVVGVKGALRCCETYANGYYSCMPLATKNRIHSTEKPVELLKHLMSFVPEGGLVVDPFAGSGSTGVAALELGLRFRGSELSEEYCRLANERLGAVIHGD